MLQLFYFILLLLFARNNPAIKLLLYIFLPAAIAFKNVVAFILFYFIADVRTFAINAALYFIAVFILFYCTWNYAFILLLIIIHHHHYSFYHEHWAWLIVGEKQLFHLIETCCTWIIILIIIIMAWDVTVQTRMQSCLLYTSDAADE